MLTLGLFWAPLDRSQDHYTQVTGGNVDIWQGLGPAYGQNGTYNGFAFTNHTLEGLKNVPAGTPFFLYHAFQECHTPNEVPDNCEAPLARCT